MSGRKLIIGVCNGILVVQELSLSCRITSAHVMKVDFVHQSETTIFINQCLYHQICEIEC